MITLDKYLVGVDIGGTQVRVALAKVDDLRADNIKKVKQDTSKEDPEGISRQVIAMIETLVKKKGIQTNQVHSINIATAGPIDMEKMKVLIPISKIGGFRSSFIFKSIQIMAHEAEGILIGSKNSIELMGIIC